MIYYKFRKNERVHFTPGLLSSLPAGIYIVVRNVKTNFDMFGRLYAIRKPNETDTVYLVPEDQLKRVKR